LLEIYLGIICDGGGGGGERNPNNNWAAIGAHCDCD